MAITLKALADELGFRTWQVLDTLEAKGYPARRGTSVLTPQEERIVREWHATGGNPMLDVAANDAMQCPRCGHGQWVHAVIAPLAQRCDRIEPYYMSPYQRYRVPVDIWQRLRCNHCGAPDPSWIVREPLNANISWPDDTDVEDPDSEMASIRAELMSDADDYSRAESGGGWFYSDLDDNG